MTLTTEQRVQMGKAVRDNISFIQLSIEDDCATRNEDYRQEFWAEFAHEMRRRDLVQAEGTLDNREFTDEDGIRFGQKECPFNQYKGIKYHAVPYDYLAFIVDSNKSLERYLRWRYSQRSEPK